MLIFRGVITIKIKWKDAAIEAIVKNSTEMTQTINSGISPKYGVDIYIMLLKPLVREKLPVT